MHETRRSWSRRPPAIAVVFASLALGACAGAGVPGADDAATDPALATLDAKDMRIVGQTDLDGNGNGGEGLDLRQYPDGRRVLFYAHTGPPTCLSTIDVTDPARPRPLAQVPTPADHVRCNSLAVSGTTLLVAHQTEEPGQPHAGVRIYDVEDPAQLRELAFFDTSGGTSHGAHFVWFVDGEYAYISTGAPDFASAVGSRDDGQFLMIVDVRDPRQPKEVGRWWLRGMRKGEPGAPLPRTKTANGVRMHTGHTLPERPNRFYVGWIDGGVVILDIADKTKPTLVGRRSWFPVTDGYIAHTALAIPGRGLLVATQEAGGVGCEGRPGGRASTNHGLQMPMWTVDISDETNPREISQFPAPYNTEALCAGIKGRVGAHNIHMNRPTPNSARLRQTVVAAMFGLGVRIYSIADPKRPEEIAYLVPVAPPGSDMGATQINDVYVDENGLIYAAERHTGGLYVMEYTGALPLR